MKCVIDDLTIHYQEYGQGIPILCIHGYYVDHRLMSGCLEPTFQKLDGYRRIYIDLPGMGKTPSKEWIQGSDNVLDILLKFIDIVIPNDNFLLMSESYGGYLSLGLTYKITERVAGLFFICPSVKANQNDRILPDRQLLIKENNINTTHRKFSDFLNMAVVASKFTWQKYQDEILPGIEAADIKFLFKLQKIGYKLSCEEEMHKMLYDKPAVMLLGKQDDVVGYNDMLFYLNNFQRGTFCIIDCAGHNLQIEQLDLLSSHLIAFLDNCRNYVNKNTKM